MTASTFEGARCRGLHALFDSTHLADHLEARRICSDCPAVAACRQQLEDVRRTSYSSGPQGTWAGLLVGSQGRPSQWSMPEHGTQSRYDIHKHQGEDACEPCLAAHREYERERAGAA